MLNYLIRLHNSRIRVDILCACGCVSKYWEIEFGKEDTPMKHYCPDCWFESQFAEVMFENKPKWLRNLILFLLRWRAEKWSNEQ